MKPAVLLLPGMTLNASIFPKLDVPTIDVDFTRMVLGPRGSSPSLLERRMALYVERLDERLNAEEAWQQASRRIVVGHSFGGMLTLAWWLANGGKANARVDGLVLTATTCGPMLRRSSIRLGSRGLRIPVPLVMPVLNLAPVTRLMKRWWGNEPDDHPVNFQAMSDKSDWAIDMAGWRNTDWRAMRSYRLAMMGFDVRDRLKEITVPSIVLCGPTDHLFDLSVGRELAKGLGADLRIIPEAGHGLPLTHGDAVIKAVRDLIGA